MFNGAASADDALDALFDNYQQYSLESDPFSATGSGVYDYNARVPTVSAEEPEKASHWLPVSVIVALMIAIGALVVRKIKTAA